jgi:hypothetical protein
MTRLLTILTLAALAGCASKKPTIEAVVVPAEYEDASAAALVFSPPVSERQPQLALSRDGRAPEAFVGFDQLTTTYHYVRFEDRQSDEFNEGYDRRSVSVRVGVSHR